MRKTLGPPLAVALVLTAVMSVPAAAETKYICPMGDFDGDLELSGVSSCAIWGDISGSVTSDGRRIVVGATGSVGGDVEVSGADLIINGPVGGDVTQTGHGHLQVRDVVGGNVEEYGRGGLFVTFSGEIAGNAGEYGLGGCNISQSASIDGNLEGSC